MAAALEVEGGERGKADGEQAGAGGLLPPARAAAATAAAFLITIASPQIYSRHPVKVKVVTVHRNGQPPLRVAASQT